MTNLLITGGTGTFGGALTERLLNDGNVNRIKIISRDEKKQQAMRTRFDDARLRFHLRDVRNLYGLTLAFRGVDVVVHAAAL
ncbi:MAG: polysaccharide biosynthesis protein, partial [Planctomycetota bacterium]